jgi:putative oxidoreductase
LSEFGGGVLLALGLFGPVGPALMIGVMTVAAVSVHWHNGLFAMSNGIELPLLYAAGAAALALTGPGRYSLDALLGLTSVWTPALSWSAIGIGLVGGIVNLSLRRTPAAVVA